MMRRLMTIVIMLLMLSSCYYFNQVVDDIKDESRTTETRKKNGGGAIDNEKYKDGVKEAMKDILKRPMNKKEEIEGIKLIIPESTSINTKLGNIVDTKTGYGIPIIFGRTSRCSDVFYRKKISSNNYLNLSYDDNPLTNEIAQKIIKANGFVNTCK